jgi:2-polyprenyl-3-methyl-5-hydroxy-6-metoxy-1,4-benzoquinol methylase
VSRRRMATIRYMMRCSKAFLFEQPSPCPNCGGIASHTISRKYLITELRRCAECELMFRVPVDDIEASRNFYSDGSYRQGFTTDLPSTALLQRLKATNFRGSPKDYSVYIEALAALGLGPGDTLFDFGCSWGYGAYQLESHRFRVTAYEISASRRSYAADRLGIECIADFDDVGPGHPLFESFDCFFSAHVLEHVTCPRQVFAWSDRLLRPGGVFVSFTPNGAEAHRHRNRRWTKLWGEVHPNLVDDRFLRRSFAAWPRLLTSSPYIRAAIERPRSGETLIGSLDGPELMFAAVKAARDRATGGSA